MKLTKEQITRRLLYEPCVLKDDKIYKVVIYFTYEGMSEITLSAALSTNCKFIGRPLSDLTKPIKQANYNEGKEFVPLEDLYKKLRPYENYYSFGRDNVLSGFTYNSEGSSMEWIEYIPENRSFNIQRSRTSLNMLMSYQYDAFQLLLKWHFVIDEPEGSYINLNELETNPYE